MINEKRDQRAAEDAVDMAAIGRKPGIGVDDDICLEAMLVRILKIMDAQKLTYEVERVPKAGGVYVRLKDSGSVYIFAADRLAGASRNLGMASSDPIGILRQVVDAAEERRKLGNLLNRVRRADESDEDTLQRLIRERATVVKLLESCGAPHDDFDWTYSRNLASALDDLTAGLISKKEG